MGLQAGEVGRGGEGSNGDIHDLVVVQIQRPQLRQRLQGFRRDRVDHVVSPATNGKTPSQNSYS